MELEEKRAEIQKLFNENTHLKDELSQEQQEVCRLQDNLNTLEGRNEELSFCFAELRIQKEELEGQVGNNTLTNYINETLSKNFAIILETRNCIYIIATELARIPVFTIFNNPFKG